MITSLLPDVCMYAPLQSYHARFSLFAGAHLHSSGNNRPFVTDPFDLYSKQNLLPAQKAPDNQSEHHTSRDPERRAAPCF